MDSSYAPVSKLTRRRLLTGASRVAAAAAASALMPPNVQRLLAQDPPRSGSLKDIKHVVLLMQENRSFDHYFGTLAGVRGFADPSALKLADGKSVFYQPDAVNPSGYLLPFRLDTRKSSAQKIPSTSHAWAVQHEAWNNGKMDQWLPAHRKADGPHGPYCMGYYNREDIPFQFALAEAFTICDTYHSSVMGPTWPNRMYWMTGTIDPEGVHGGPILKNTAPQDGYTWTTYAERLEQAGISWKVYQQKDNYGCNLLETFKVFREAAIGSPLYTKAMERGEEGQFEDDAKNDRLTRCLLDNPHQLSIGTSGLHAGGWRGLCRRQDRRHRGQPRRLGKDSFYSQLRRERRHLRSCAATRASRGYSSRVCKRSPYRRRVPSALHRHFAVVYRRMGLQSTLRSHLGASVSGTIHRRAGVEHQRLAAEHFWRSDFRIAHSAGGQQGPILAGRPRAPDPGQIRGCAFAQAGAP